MHVTELRLTNFRNHPHTRIELHPGLNVFWGGNGEGKTNLLEAIYVATLGRSPRALSDQELIRHGSPAALVECIVEQADRGQGEIGWRLESGPRARRRRLVNGSAVRGDAVLGWLRVVLFGPDELEIVKGSGEARRRLLNVALAQSEPAYAGHLSRLNRALTQRNRLLRQIAAGEAPQDALEEWDGLVAEESGWLISRRRGFVSELAPLARAMHAELAGGEEVLSLEYLPGGGDGGEEMAAVIRTQLRERRAEELARGVTLTGAHRDDVRIDLNGRPARAFGSQGQQRSIAIAIKSAERRVQAGESGQPPVMLLDDVLSELDPGRQAGLLHLLAQDGQALITTSQEAEARRLTGTGRRFAVTAGQVTPEAS